MAGEFHHNLGCDADGEHEADEGLAAAVGADFGVFGDGDIASATFAEAGDVEGLVEAVAFTDLFFVVKSKTTTLTALDLDVRFLLPGQFSLHSRA